MSQKGFLADLDARLHGAFAGAGLADAGQYTAPGGAAPVVVQVYVDRAVQTDGQGGQFITNAIEVGIVHAAGVAPVQKGRLQVDGDLFELTKQLSFDGSMSRWSVRHV